MLLLLKSIREHRIQDLAALEEEIDQLAIEIERLEKEEAEKEKISI